MTERILLRDLRLDGETQTRAAMNQGRVAEYAELMKDGEEFPPIIVFFDGTVYWVADGFHRAHGAKQAGRVHIEADVRQGTKADCIRFAVGANKEHDHAGLRRSNADKRRSVEMLLGLLKEEGQNWSSVMVAEHCGVHRSMVDYVRHAKFAGDSDAPRLGRDGRVQKQAGNPKPKPDAPKPLETKEAAAAPAPEPVRSPSERPVTEATKARDAKVKDMLDQGMSAREIAKEIGCERGAVYQAKSRIVGAAAPSHLNHVRDQADGFATALSVAIEVGERKWSGATREQRMAAVDALKRLNKTTRKLIAAIESAEEGGSQC